MAYRHLQSNNFQGRIEEKISRFKNLTRDISGHFIPSNSPIQSLVVGGNVETKAIEDNLKDNGYNVKAILSPTVPAGKERLRICLHTFNTEEELAGLASIIRDTI